MTARFLIAKYVPDTKRMEPRNIGVIVWNNGRAHARFFGEGLPIPKSVGLNDKITYNKWVASWRSQIAKPVLEYGRGKTANKATPEFLDALREWSRANYLLVDGGFVAESIANTEIENLTEYLFTQLVSRKEVAVEKEGELRRLRSRVGELLAVTRLRERPNFVAHELTWYKTHGVARYFYSDYSYGPTGKPHSIYNMMPLTNETVFDARAFHLDSFKRSCRVPQNRIAAFVSVPTDPTEEQQSKLAFLEKIATVIDVTDEAVAATRLTQTADANGEA